VGLSTTAIFSVFAAYFFGNFRDEASVIAIRSPSSAFSDPKMYDLEWLFHVKFGFRAGLAGSDRATFEK